MEKTQRVKIQEGKRVKIIRRKGALGNVLGVTAFLGFIR